LASIVGSLSGRFATSGARFLRALLVERILLAPDLMAAMMDVGGDEHPDELTLLGVPTPVAYGLGLFRRPTSCGVVWGHSGGGFGYGHLPFVDLETGRVAILMRNASFGFRQLTHAELARRVDFTADLRSSLYCS
jgi:hypothetical protein